MSLLSFIPIVIALLVLLVAAILYHIAMDILDEGNYFWIAIWGFLIFYALAAVAMYFFVIHPNDQPDVSGAVHSFFTILPSQLEQGVIK